MKAQRVITNQPADALKPGDRAEIVHRILVGDMRGFTGFADDVTGHGIDRALAADPDFRAALAQGGIAVSLLISLIITRLPGPGTRLDTLSLDVLGVPKQGETVVADVTVAALDPATRKVQLDCRCRRESGQVILSGQIGVIAPETQLSRPFGRPVALAPGQPWPQSSRRMASCLRFLKSAHGRWMI